MISTMPSALAHITIASDTTPRILGPGRGGGGEVMHEVGLVCDVVDNHALSCSTQLT